MGPADAAESPTHGSGSGSDIFSPHNLPEVEDKTLLQEARHLLNKQKEQ